MNEELKEYIDQLNATKQTKIISDLSYWSARRVDTPKELERYLLICSIQELQKNLYGSCHSREFLEDLTTSRMNEKLKALKQSASLKT